MLKEFKVNKEGAFSITRPYESSQIIREIKKVVGHTEELIITDATACMGGDLVNFSRVFKFVNGVEIDEENFSYLQQNVQFFNCQNVNLFCQDYLDIFRLLKQDIIYIDPPWGGTDYKIKKEVNLKIGDVDLWELIEMIRDCHITKFIFVKVPLNVSLEFIKYDYIETIYNKNLSETFRLLVITI